MAEREKCYDIIIAGAGPAGCAAALALRNSGLKVMMVDKSFFPRDKICGDAIGSRVHSVLQKIEPAFSEQLKKFPHKNITKGCRLYSPSNKAVDIHYVKEGYIARRMDFDHFLFELVNEHAPATTIIENFKLTDVKRDDQQIKLYDNKGKEFCARLVIACDGAHSIIAKKLANFKVEPNHYSGAVRAYYTNISGITEKDMMEVHLVKNYLPGYFWLFPLSDHTANVGFGMLTKDISLRKIDLKKALQEIVTTSPPLKERFKNAKLEGAIKGFGLPLGAKKRPVSGERFMLCGDAASLIDPLTGEGIGNAMMSGLFAAQQAIKCFEKNDFSAINMKAYDEMIYGKLLAELKKKFFLQRLFNREWLINLAMDFSLSNGFIRKRLTSKL